MRTITLFRGLAWIGALVVFGSLVLVRWGADPNLPGGPPGTVEKFVVGACLLAALSAMAISVSGRKRIPPSWTARIIATASAAAILAITVYIRSHALSTGFTDILRGQGWLWLFAGGGMLLGAAVGTLGLKPPPAPHKQRKRH
jgi:hypothetical protein